MEEANLQAKNMQHLPLISVFSDDSLSPQLISHYSKEMYSSIAVVTNNCHSHLLTTFCLAYQHDSGVECFIVV